MNARDAKRDMCRVAALLLQNYLDVGQPYDEHGCSEQCDDCERKARAMESLRDEMYRRAGY